VRSPVLCVLVDTKPRWWWWWWWRTPTSCEFRSVYFILWRFIFCALFFWRLYFVLFSYLIPNSSTVRKRRVNLYQKAKNCNCNWEGLIVIGWQYCKSNVASVIVQIQLEGNSMWPASIVYVVQLTRGLTLNCPVGMRCHRGVRQPPAFGGNFWPFRLQMWSALSVELAARTNELTYITA